MTPEIIFLWIPLLSFGITAFRLLGQRHWQPGLWYTGLAAIVVAWHGLALPYAVEVSGGLWLVYGLLLPIMSGVSFAAVQRRHYGRARALQRLTALLMPLPGYSQSAGFSQAFTLIEQGEIAAGLSLLERAADERAARGDTRQANLARMHAALLRQDYRQAIELAGSNAGFEQPSLRLLGIRALCEQGMLNEAVLAFTTEQDRFRKMTTGVEVALAQNALFIHAGDVEAVRALTQGALSAFPENELAVAVARAQYFADGDWQQLIARLEQIRKTASGGTRHLIDRWLHGTPQPRHTISPETRATLAAMRSQLISSRHYYRQQIKRPVVAIAMMAANTVMFLATTGSDGVINMRSQLVQETIFVYPYMAEYNEWWRLLTANFLHYNYLHIGFNMLALALFGFAVERRIGHWRFLAIYLISGLGSMLAAILDWELGADTEQQFALGASGAIFGILGVVLAQALIHYRRTRLFEARRDIISIGLILLIQTGFDLSFLHGSSPLHLAGFVTGFLLALALLWREDTMTEPRTGASEPPPPPTDPQA